MLVHVFFNTAPTCHELLPECAADRCGLRSPPTLGWAYGDAGPVARHRLGSQRVTHTHTYL